MLKAGDFHVFQSDCKPSLTKFAPMPPDPGEFKDAKAAGQVKDSPYRFTRAHWSRPLIWLAEGWVVLERFAMPILGEGDAEPNDTFVQQVVANASAACEEVIRRGVTTPGTCDQPNRLETTALETTALEHCCSVETCLSRRRMCLSVCMVQGRLRWVVTATARS